jgi:streptogramin lyase
MKNSIYKMAIILFVYLAPCLLSAQSFTLEVTPNTQTAAINRTATYFITVNPVNGYNASVFLSVSSTPQFYGTVELSTTTINPPYKTATLKIIPTIQDTGTKVIELKAMNNGVSTTATCSLTIQKNVQWTTITPPGSTSWHKMDVILRTDTAGDVMFCTYPEIFPTTGISISHYRNQQWEFDTFNSSGTASQNANIPFAVDTKGAYWCVTNQGIIRYDGAFTTLYNTLNSGLVSNSPTSIVIDRNGSPVCIGSDKTGTYIQRFTGSEWNTTKFVYPQEVKSLPPTLHIDASNQVWIPTLGGGIIRIQDTMQENIRANGNQSIGSDDVWQIVGDNDGGVWCLNSGSSPEKLISYFDGTSWKYISAPAITGLVPRTLFIDTDKHIWLSSAIGLHYYDGSTWTTYDKTNSPLPKGTWSIVQDKNKNIWMVIDNLFYIFNPNGIVGIPLAPTGVEEQSAPTDGITIFPNPTNTSFTISGADNILSVKLMNSLGMEISRKSLVVSGKVDVDVADLASGVYFVQMRTSTGMITKSVIVSR